VLCIFACLGLPETRDSDLLDKLDETKTELKVDKPANNVV